ncbi:MAG TPA: hypothetical protein VHM90_16620 [Phycisphaerae bacterium]|nr:hypothetical protein [Phycisphaerae bacterium]
MSEIIHDVNGGKLRLSKTRLTEVTGVKWCWRFLKVPVWCDETKQLGWVTIVVVCCGDRIERSVLLNHRTRRIGCRRFSPEVWAKIMKAADKCWTRK